MSERTPGLARAEKEKTRNGDYGFDIFFGDTCVIGEEGIYGNINDEANAHFIVKAANAYDKDQKLIAEMREALVAVIEHHIILGGLADCGPSQSVGTNPTEEAYYNMMQKARKAFAKAEGVDNG